MKKEIIVILFVMFALVNSINSFADEFGCCSNPGAGDRTCWTGENSRLVSRDTECCPEQSKNHSYYKSSQNPDEPTNYDACVTNFFFANKDCSDLSVTGCSLGCC